MEPFYSYSAYLREKYGKKAYRIAVDGGFSCPNRGTDRSRPGCIYCSSQGARASYLDKAAMIEEQITRGLAFTQRRYKAKVFLLYFQAFSNTYDTPENLKKIYDHALSLGNFSELIVATRPDCIDREKADLLASYRDKGLDVWVELGLQSANDRTLSRINRGHSRDDYEQAFDVLHQKGLKIATHLILGLPGEDFSDMEESVRYVGALHPHGVKFHDLNITYNTALFDEYLKGELTVPSRGKYIEYLISCIEMLPRDIVLMRLTCDTYEADRAAPRKYMSKGNIYDLVKKKMIAENRFQGRNFTEA